MSTLVLSPTSNDAGCVSRRAQPDLWGPSVRAESGRRLGGAVEGLSKQRARLAGAGRQRNRKGKEQHRTSEPPTVDRSSSSQSSVVAQRAVVIFQSPVNNLISSTSPCYCCLCFALDSKEFRLCIPPFRLPTLPTLSRSHRTRARQPHTYQPNMSARQQQMGRPGGARFAQFKLVLLGMSDIHSDTLRDRMLTMLSQVNLPSERCAIAFESNQPPTVRLTHSRVRSSSVSSRTSSTTTENPPSAPLSSPKQSPSMTQPPSNSRSGILQVKSATSLWPPCTTATPTVPL